MAIMLVRTCSISPACIFTSPNGHAGDLPVAGQPALICPAFEATKTQRSPIAWQLFTYIDGQDPLEAFHAAGHALQLDRAQLGIEAYKMRVLELRLLEKAAIR